MDDADEVLSVISNGSSVRSAKIKKIITNEDENRIEIITEEDELASVQDVIWSVQCFILNSLYFSKCQNKGFNVNLKLMDNVLELDK